jgi:predicted GNAT family acetyltransferase
MTVIVSLGGSGSAGLSGHGVNSNVFTISSKETDATKSLRLATSQSLVQGSGLGVTVIRGSDVRWSITSNKNGERDLISTIRGNDLSRTALAGISFHNHVHSTFVVEDVSSERHAVDRLPSREGNDHSVVSSVVVTTELVGSGRASGLENKVLEEITSIIVTKLRVNCSVVAVCSLSVGERRVHKSNLKFCVTEGIQIAGQLSNGLGWIQSSASVSSNHLLGLFEIIRNFANWHGFLSVVGVINGLGLTGLGSLFRLRTTTINQTSFLVSSSIVTGRADGLA